MNAPPTPPTLTLCTWTFNDAPLLRGLLASLAGWTVQPDAVIIMDDGSAPPFALPPGLAALPPLTLLRHPTNKGTAAAKHACISAATTDIILAMDCDVRLPPEWLAAVLPLLDDPAVGQASSPLRQQGDDISARYISRYLLPSATPPMPEHMPGPVCCLRQEAWVRCGGMAGHAHPTGEDVLLGKRLASLGLRPAWRLDLRAEMVRRLSRRALVRRSWAWFKPCAATARGGKKGIAAMTCAACATHLHRHAHEMLLGVVRRAVIAAQAQDFSLVYIDLLFAAHALADRLACNAATTGSIPPEEAGRFRTALDATLAPYPNTLALLHADLAAMGTPLPPPSPSRTDTRRWREILTLVHPALSPLLKQIETHTVDALTREDQREHDFSFYDTLP